MKFLIDENIVHGVDRGLAAVYLSHEFVSAHSDPSRYCGVDDLDLFPVAAQYGFDAIVTHDKNQLKKPAERAMLLECGLHWIGHQSKEHSGLLGLALSSATLVAGMPFVLDDWRNAPHAYRLTGVGAQKGQRLKVSPVAVPVGGDT